MAAPISASFTCFCSSSSLATTSHLFAISSQQSYPKSSNFHLSSWFAQLGSSRISPYNGLKHLGIPISLKSTRSERKRRFKGLVVHASLFGVGAPEALVIGVVALLVFGPKGLAEVARNLGKTLRAFQPTIRELQDVSREFKSTLEREIGLDDISNPTTFSSNRFNTEDPNGAPSQKAYTSEDYLKMTEEQLKAASNRRSETQNQTQEQPNTASTQTTSGENQSKPTQNQTQEQPDTTPTTTSGETQSKPPPQS